MKNRVAEQSPAPKPWSRNWVRRALRAALLASTVAASFGGAAKAQQAATTSDLPALQEIVVTGSNIKRAEAETVENVQVISAVDIQNSGQETVADYLRTISSTFGNSINESFSNSFAPGAAMVGLRGLSGKDTLVLLNGRRITNYGLFQNLSDSFVDLNVIPLAAIDRIEILKSGGSAIYGSDAVAGVINIILKENTTEKAVEVGGRLTTDGGAATRDANVRFGFGDFASDGYNVFATASAWKRDQLLFSQRSNTAGQNYTGLPDGDLAYALANQYPNVPSAFPTCGAIGLPGKAITGTAGPGCYYNDANELSLLPGSERANLTATANLRLTDTWKAYSDLFFSNEETQNNFTPEPFNASAFVADLATGGATAISNILPGTNPASIGGMPTPINYAFQSVGDRNVSVVSNTFRVTAGVKGTWNEWDIDAGYGHSENHVSVEEQNNINAANLVADIADGSFNFLNPGLTPAANAALGLLNTFASVAKLDTFDAKASGGLFDLPGGRMSIAVGAEVRHESVDDQPGAAEADALVLETGVTRVIGSRNIYAAFSEFDFPILKSLDADIAVREEHYTGNIGSNLRPQATLRWQPISAFSMRAVYADGFRAPSLAEASNSVSIAHQVVTDPLDPEHRPSETVGYITGGNPLVKPEISKNLDLGFVVSPTNHLNLSADFYSIFIYRVIAPNASAQQIILDPAAYPGELLRSSNGTVVYAEALYTNQFKIHTSGVDVNTDLTVPLAVGGRLKFGAGATYVATFQVNQGGIWTNFDGSNGWDYLSPISGGGPVPRWKGSIFGGWDNHDWAGQATLRYTNGYQNAITAAGFGTTQQNIASFDAVDLAGEYRGLKNWKFTLSVVNLFNRYPPYDSAALLFFPSGTPYDPLTYDDLGRMVDLHVTFKY
jgi:iron complex outermembrane recepter protein